MYIYIYIYIYINIECHIRLLFENIIITNNSQSPTILKSTLVYFVMSAYTMPV